MNISPISNPLSWKYTSSIIKKWDWETLNSILETTNWTKEHAVKLMVHIRRFGGVIDQRNDNEIRKKKALFLNSFSEAINDKGHTDLARDITNFRSDIAKFEKSYTQILGALKNLSLKSYPPRSALYNLMLETTTGGQKMLSALIAKQEENQKFESTTRYIDQRHGMVDVDRANSVNITIVSMTAKMFGYANMWFNSAGDLVLPNDYRKSIKDEGYIQSIGSLGLAWRNLEHTERRFRFLKGRLNSYSLLNPPPNAPSDFKGATEYEPFESDIELFDKIANLRAKGKANQNLIEMKAKVILKTKGLNVSTPLPPNDFIADEEIHGYSILTNSLSFDIGADTKKYGDLRLVEWLRGYSALKLFIEEQIDENKPKSSLIELPEKSYLDLLGKNGLNRTKAKVFITSLCFKKSSDDLFDAPLIKIDNGNLLLFGQALRNANLPALILSSLSNRRIQITRKGKAFENEVIKLLNQQDDIEVGTYKGKQIGDNVQEEFELDAIAIWQNHIFLFECKNETLSDGTPSAIAYFESDLQANVKQTNRQLRGLKTYPEILNTAFKGRFKESELQQMSLIPCILYNKPYARIGPIDGIYICDFSSLSRFFEERHIKLNIISGAGKNPVGLSVPVYDLWNSDKPSAMSLTSHIETPIQVKIYSDHMEWTEKVIPVVAGHYLFAPEFEYREPTFASQAISCGTDPYSFSTKVNIANQTIDASKKGNRSSRRKHRKTKR